MNQLDGEYNTINEKYHKAEHDLTMVNKVKGQLEDNLKIQNNEMQKFQIEYEEQIGIWKREKSDYQNRIHELAAYQDKIKYDGQEQIEQYKQKY